MVLIIFLPCWWSQIASFLPGRTDNQIKNWLRSHMNKPTTMITVATGQNHDSGVDSSTTYKFKILLMERL